jgi:uncharacterized membrane protein YfcA
MPLALLAALAGAVVQAATGFGFALVLSPALFAVLDPVEAVTALLVLGAALSVLVLLEGHEVRPRLLAPMLLASLPGLALGALLLSALSKEALQVGVGVAVVAAALWQLQHRAARTLPAPVAGVLSGALTTSISINGPPLVLWLEGEGIRPAEFRATLAAAFLALDVVGAALIVSTQGRAAVELEAVGPLLACVLGGYWVGALAFRRLDPERFYPVVLGLVICTGIASVLAGIR